MSADARRRETAERINHTLLVEGHLYRLNGMLQRAESSERGFLLTDDESYLWPFDQVTRDAQRELDDLAQLVADNPTQRRSLVELGPIVAERLDILKQKIELVRAGRAQDAVAVLKTGRGKALMERLLSIIDAMEREEQRLYLEREEHRAEATTQMEIAFFVMAVAMVCAGLVALFSSRNLIRELEARTRAQQAALAEAREHSARREAAEAQLRQAQKLEALGRMTGGIAHDFNNMLAVIIASLNILRRKLQRGETEWEPLVDSAVAGADSAAKFVRKLLAFARMQPLTPAPLDVNALVLDAVKMLQGILGANIKLELALADNLRRVEVDAGELQSALVNLVVNARDAMPDGGRLTIETQNYELDARPVNGGDRVPGRFVMIAVTDTGEGMKPQVLANAFDPFFTTKPPGRGSGLGLSQVHGFVKQSGGHVRIYSEPGRGASVKIFLPDCDDAGAGAALSKPAPLAGAEYPAGLPGETILVVDDNETARGVTAAAMRELGYRALEFDSAEGALKALEKGGVTLVVSDVVMSPVNGVDLAQTIAGRWPEIPVLLVTGFTRMALTRNGLGVEKAELLTKPFTLSQIAVKVRSMIDAAAAPRNPR